MAVQEAALEDEDDVDGDDGDLDALSDLGPFGDLDDLGDLAEALEDILGDTTAFGGGIHVSFDASQSRGARILLSCSARSFGAT